jgi:hypothetical protein
VILVYLLIGAPIFALTLGLLLFLDLTVAEAVLFIAGVTLLAGGAVWASIG